MGDGNLKGYMTITARVETITPELAAAWLKLNHRNRALNLTHVEGLANAMKAGEWRDTHQGIAFGADGSLYDGQHRLHAIVKANVAVVMRVTRGLPQDALDAIDTGDARKATDVLAIADGVKIGTHMRAAIMGARAIVSGSIDAHRSRTTVDSLRAAIADHGEDYKAIAAVTGSSHDRLQQGPMLAALCVCHRVMPAPTLEFVRLMRDPSGLSKDHPAFVLREYVLRTYYANARTRDDLTMRTIVAVQALARGESRKIVKAGPAVRAAIVAQWKRVMGRE